MKLTKQRLFEIADELSVDMRVCLNTELFAHTPLNNEQARRVDIHLALAVIAGALTALEYDTSGLHEDSTAEYPEDYLKWFNQRLAAER